MKKTDVLEAELAQLVEEKRKIEDKIEIYKKAVLNRTEYEFTNDIKGYESEIDSFMYRINNTISSQKEKETFKREINYLSNKILTIKSLLK